MVCKIHPYCKIDPPQNPSSRIKGTYFLLFSEMLLLNFWWNKCPLFLLALPQLISIGSASEIWVFVFTLTNLLDQWELKQKIIDLK